MILPTNQHTVGKTRGSQEVKLPKANIQLVLKIKRTNRQLENELGKFRSGTSTNQHTVGKQAPEVEKFNFQQTNIQLEKRFANLFREQISAHLKIRRSSFDKEALLIFKKADRKP